MPSQTTQREYLQILQQRFHSIENMNLRLTGSESKKYVESTWNAARERDGGINHAKGEEGKGAKEGKKRCRDRTRITA